MTLPLDERRTADGRRRINLTRAERFELVERERVEAAVALFLDITVHRTTQEIADELGISRKQLKKLTQRDDFIALYNEHFIELGHDPRLQAIKSGIADLLPIAFEELQKLLVGPNTSPSVRRKAIMDIFDLNGVKPADPKGSNKRELAEYLKEVGAQVTLNQFNFQIPQDYDQALNDLEEGIVDEEEPDVLTIEGVFRDEETGPDQDPEPAA